MSAKQPRHYTQCHVLELLIWYEENKGLPKKARSELDIGEGFRVSIGPHGGSLVFKHKAQRSFLVKLLSGSSNPSYDHFGKVMISARTTFGAATIMDRILYRTVQRGAFWLVIDEY